MNGFILVLLFIFAIFLHNVGNEDGAIYSWNIETGKELGEMQVGSKVYGLDFSKAAKKTYAITAGDTV